MGNPFFDELDQEIAVAFSGSNTSSPKVLIPSFPTLKPLETRSSPRISQVQTSPKNLVPHTPQIVRSASSVQRASSAPKKSEVRPGKNQSTVLVSYRPAGQKPSEKNISANPVTSSVLKSTPSDRRFLETQKQLGQQGVVVLVFSLGADHAIIDLHIETRGFIHTFEARRIHGIIAQAARKIFLMTHRDVPDIEERPLARIIQDDLGKILYEKTQKKPLVVSIFLGK